MNGLNINLSNLSIQQISTLSKAGNTDQLPSKINQIHDIQKITDGPTYDTRAPKYYSHVLRELDATQTALLLSTQGVSNAQIRQTLVARELTVENQYAAMSEAGLLKNRKALYTAEVESTLQSILLSESRANQAAKSLGLSTAMGKEHKNRVRLTSGKLQEAVATGALNQAEAQQIAMTLGVSIAQNTQTASTMPRWIASLKAMTIATWEQVTATAAWLLTNPAGWLTMAVGGFGLAIAAVLKLTTSLKEQKEILDETKTKYKDTVSEWETINSQLEEARQRIDELRNLGPLSFLEQQELDNLKEAVIQLGLAADAADKVKKREAEELSA